MADQVRPGRILGLDYGSKTVGVAVSDPLGLTAQGVETIRREKENKLRRTLSRIEELSADYGAVSIVLGLPLNLDGSEGERAQKTLAFKDMLERRTGLPVHLMDERLTTNAAHRVLDEAGIRMENRKPHLDRMAAALILQSYLDRLAAGKAQRDINGEGTIIT